MAKRPASDSVLRGVILSDLQPLGIGVAVLRLDTSHAEAILADIRDSRGSSQRLSMPLTQATTILHVAPHEIPLLSERGWRDILRGKCRTLQLIDALPPHGLKPARLSRLDARRLPSSVTIEAVVQGGPTHNFGSVRERDLEIAAALSAPADPTRLRSLLTAHPAEILALLSSPPAGVSATLARLRGLLTPADIAPGLESDARKTRELAQSVLGLIKRR